MVVKLKASLPCLFANAQHGSSEDQEVRRSAHTRHWESESFLNAAESEINITDEKSVCSMMALGQHL